MITNERAEVAQILVLGTADWNQPIATNQHYVVRELLRDGANRVTFVESMALRSPRLNMRDLRRIWSRLRSSLPGRNSDGPAATWREKPPGLTVVSPLTLPWHRGAARIFNRFVLHRLVKDWATSPGRHLLWTYTPLTYGIERYSLGRVYHCVDLLGEVPGIDSNLVHGGEEELAANGFAAAATSATVRTHLSQSGFRDIKLWENVADVDLIEQYARPTHLSRASRALFAGNLSPSKIDYELLIQLADAGAEVVLAGPRAEGGDRDDEQFSRLVGAGVTYLGMLRPHELAEQLWNSRVGLIPYVLNSYTSGVSPLKTFEYLAAELPVVSTALPGVAPIDQHVFVESDRESFVRRVLDLLNNDPAAERADGGHRASLARQHSWQGRGEEARAFASERAI